MKQSDNTIASIKKDFIAYFENEFDFNVVMKYILGEEKDNKLKSDVVLTKKQFKTFIKILKKYSKHIPLAYILKRQYFFNKYFITDKNVFIPRQDSEAMIEDLVTNNDIKDKNIVDLCSGTGALGLSVKEHEKTAKLTLVDFYKKPLKLSQLNAKPYNNVDVVKANFVDYLLTTDKVFDFAIINPPYIEMDDENVSQSVKENEPDTALYADNAGLIYYQELFAFLDDIYEKHPKLKIYCEFGFSQKKALEQIYNNKRKIKFKKDYQGNWRYFIIGA